MLGLGYDPCRLPASRPRSVERPNVSTRRRQPRAVCCTGLLGGASRVTLHDVKTSALTIRLDPELERRLSRAAKRSGRTRSEFVRDALRRQLAMAQLEDLRRRIMPFAEAQGYLTDEDVFHDVS